MRAVRLIVGLGNTGVRYERTRHNAGFMVVEALAREEHAGAWLARCESLICFANIGPEQVLLAKPLTFMNVSGRAVQLLLREHALETKEMVLVLDDLNLPLGKIRIRERGSAGGHRGLESVARALETEEFIRVRIGIGEEGIPEDKADFVLAEFPPVKKPDWEDAVARAVQAVRLVIAEGVQKAMSIANA